MAANGIAEIASPAPVSKEAAVTIEALTDDNDGVGKIALPLENGQATPAVHSYPKSRVQLEDRYIDEPRELKVVVIGAGLTGILAGVLFPAKVPGIKLTIYEKNRDLGGTWFENVYPGVRCDVPSHVYQATFDPKVDWSDHFAPGAEIREYWQSIGRKYDVYKHTKLSHKVEDAVWEPAESVWLLKIRNLETGEVISDKADFLLTAIGRFNEWKLPNYPGLSDYKGLLRHASNYDPTFDPTGKKIAVIGNGASGIQLVANLNKHVVHLDHYARNKTWVSTSFAGDDRSFEAQPITTDQIKSFKDPETYQKFRKSMEDKYWRTFPNLIKGSEQNEKAREKFTKIFIDRLAKKPELLESLVPDFSAGCRRITPGPGYLEALTEDNVSYIRTPIKRFTETGIETVDGVHREVDAIFCATGANGSMAPPFPIRIGDRDIQSTWAPDGEHGFPYTYLGLATPGFPNLFFVQGPHGTGAAGTVPHDAENQLTYFAKVLRKASREGIKTISPQKKAADDFVEYSDAFFGQTVLSDNCSSWYNGGRPGARIHGIWPGSAAQLTLVRREPRWEDWDYEYLSDTGNRFLWYFGKGLTKKETVSGSDMTSYLKVPTEVDLRSLHENWWDRP